MTFPRAFARYTRGAANKMTLHLAGHAAFADLEHTGRKSGIVRHTPVRAFRTGDTVVIGLNFGRQSDWYQNIKAAGTCRIRLGGSQLTLGAPVLLPAAEATRDMPWLFGFALRRVVHTAECVQLPVLHSAAATAGRRAQLPDRPARGATPVHGLSLDYGQGRAIPPNTSGCCCQDSSRRLSRRIFVPALMPPHP